MVSWFGFEGKSRFGTDSVKFTRRNHDEQVINGQTPGTSEEKQDRIGWVLTCVAYILKQGQAHKISRYPSDVDDQVLANRVFLGGNQNAQSSENLDDTEEKHEDEKEKYKGSHDIFC
jgi:hypothetical protein